MERRKALKADPAKTRDWKDRSQRRVRERQRKTGSGPLTTRGTPRQRSEAVQRTCKQCGGKFWAEPNQLARGFAKFCSRACQSEAQRKPPKVVACKHCGNEFKVPPSVAAAGRKFCSRACAREGRKGERSHSAKTGQYAGRKYFKSGMATCAVDGCENPVGHEHHVVYEQKVRLIRPFDRHDPRNALGLCYSCHRRHHNRTAVISLRVLREENYDYAAELLGGAAFDYLRSHYDGEDPRLYRVLPAEHATPEDWIAAEELDDKLEAAGLPRTALAELTRAA